MYPAGVHLRPKSVPVIAFFLFLATVLAATVAVSLIWPLTSLESLWALNPRAAVEFHRAGPLAAIPLFFVGVATTAAGIGLLRGRKWAWWFAVSLFGLDVCGSIARLFVIGDVVQSATGIAVSAGFLFFLCRRPVRAYFAESAKSMTHTTR